MHALLAAAILLAQIPLSETPCTRDSSDSPLETLIGDVSDAGNTPSLAPCASRLMKKIYQGARSQLENATTPPGWMSTAASTPQGDVYIGGGEIFPAMAEIIERAQEDLTYQTYQFEPESWPAQQIFDALARLHRTSREEGRRVHVHLILDSSAIGMGTPRAGSLAEQVHAQLSKRGMRLHLPFQSPPESGVQIDLAIAKHVGQATYHVKTLTRDGVESFVTGANTAAYWGRVEPDGSIESWYDVGYRFEGEVAGSHRSEFGDAWAKARRWTCSGSGGTFDKCNQVTRALGAVKATKRPPETCTPVVVVGSDMRESIVGHFGEPLENPLNYAVLAAIDGSHDLIRMQTPIFNSEAAEDAVKDALRRGVTVKLVLSKGYQNWQKWIPGNGNGGFFGGANNDITLENLYGFLHTELGLTQVQACRRLQVRWYSRDGRTAIEGKQDGQSHQKFYSFDNQVVAVGSMNMDHQSWYHAREMLTFVDDAGTTAAWNEQVFDANFARGVIPKLCTEPWDEKR